MKRLSVFAAAGFVGMLGISVGAVAQSAPAVNEDVTIALASEPSPETPEAARHEAVAAFAQEQRDCRREQGRDSQQQCLRAARGDYNHLMSLARHESRSQ